MTWFGLCSNSQMISSSPLVLLRRMFYFYLTRGLLLWLIITSLLQTWKDTQTLLSCGWFLIFPRECYKPTWHAPNPSSDTLNCGVPLGNVLGRPLFGFLCCYLDKYSIVKFPSTVETLIHSIENQHSGRESITKLYSIQRKVSLVWIHLLGCLNTKHFGWILCFVACHTNSSYSPYYYYWLLLVY